MSKPVDLKLKLRLKFFLNSIKLYFQMCEVYKKQKLFSKKTTEKKNLTLPDFKWITFLLLLFLGGPLEK